MKAIDSIEQHFPLVLFITMFKVVLAFATVDNFHDLTIQIKSVEQPFPTGLFVVLFKEVQPLSSVDKILKPDHSNAD